MKQSNRHEMSTSSKLADSCNVNRGEGSGAGQCSGLRPSSARWLAERPELTQALIRDRRNKYLKGQSI